MGRSPLSTKTPALALRRPLRIPHHACALLPPVLLLLVLGLPLIPRPRPHTRRIIHARREYPLLRRRRIARLLFLQHFRSEGRRRRGGGGCGRVRRAVEDADGGLEGGGGRGARARRGRGVRRGEDGHGGGGAGVPRRRLPNHSPPAPPSSSSQLQRARYA
ncbi:hypothetical protein C8R45DRAFT_1171774 [Mycena sanguinolenta]|nr:hypothetical protein C8R45DRAFT_1171774 [Mycena sanguinolenta]